MANRERGEQTLVAGPDRYVLRLTLGACGELEDRSGKALDALLVGANKGTLTDLRWILWAALQAYHHARFPEPEDVGRLMDHVRDLPKQLRAFLALNADRDHTPWREGGRRPGPERRQRIWARWLVEFRADGLPTADFWNLSLRELWLERAAWRLRARRARAGQITTAWYAAALVWQKKLPGLDKLLATPQGPQSREAQRMVMQTLSNQLGIPIQRVKRAKKEL